MRWLFSFEVVNGADVTSGKWIRQLKCVSLCVILYTLISSSHKNHHLSSTLCQCNYSLFVIIGLCLSSCRAYALQDDTRLKKIPFIPVTWLADLYLTRVQDIVIDNTFREDFLPTSEYKISLSKISM